MTQPQDQRNQKESGSHIAEGPGEPRGSGDSRRPSETPRSSIQHHLYGSRCHRRKDTHLSGRVSRPAILAESQPGGPGASFKKASSLSRPGFHGSCNDFFNFFF